MKRRLLIRSAIVLAWLSGLFWLIRYEAHPEWFTHSLKGYDGLIGRDILVSDTWMRVLDNGRPVGYSHTSVDVDDDETLRHIVFENRTHVRIEMMGHSQPIHTVASAYLDMDYRMQEFAFSMDTGVIDVKVNGTRSKDGPFDLTIDTAGQTRRMRLDIPDDIVIHSPMTALAVRNLEVGQYVKVKTFNPVTLAQETATVRALLRETIELPDGPVYATKLEIDYAGSRFHAWVNKEGQLLRQQTPIGWTLEKCRPDQIYEDKETTTLQGYGGKGSLCPLLFPLVPPLPSLSPSCASCASWLLSPNKGPHIYDLS